MGDLVSFHDDIEDLGIEFTRAASSLKEALMQLTQASNHVRQAFHNHPDSAGAAVAPFTTLHGHVTRVQELVDALGRTLCDTGNSYADNDTDVAKGWERVPTDASDAYRG
ncbi:MAG: hypothetical protein JOZ75_10955 [Candidatus Dormibacteraeota bacterium]|nr:hypothetical protein [Candidatus Dormibacteraeota bacterium]